MMIGVFDRSLARPDRRDPPARKVRPVPKGRKDRLVLLASQVLRGFRARRALRGRRDPPA
jgi:hypothetical protein